MRILWLSNAAWAPSGYGEQTALFAKRLQALGHDVALMANWGLNGMISDNGWHGMRVYPSDNRWGNETIATYAKHWNADLVIALCDAWVLHPDEWADTHVAVWAPVDHNPIPPAVLATLGQPNVTPIAMSTFGIQQMQACNLDPFYIPHGYDPNVFRPRPEMRDKVRDTLGVPRDAFLVGMVAANKGNRALPRKGFPQAFNAVSTFRRSHPETWLYVHASPLPGVEGGIDLATLAIALGLRDQLIFPHDDQFRVGMDASLVALLYQAFDCLLAPSMGEGFGIPILESQASGCPVIVSNHSAMTELCHAGWLVEGDPFWDGNADSFFICPHVSSIVDALEHAYDARGDQELRAEGVEWAAGYQADVVTVDGWVPALEQIEARLKPAESRQVRRARERREAKQREKVLA